MPEKTSLSGRQLDWLLRLLLVGAVTVVFWPALKSGFVNWDDPRNIFQNPHLTLAWENIKWMFTDCSYVRRYLPLGWLSYAVDRSLFGGSPLSYHVGNLLLHAVNALLLFAILKRLLQGTSHEETNLVGVRIAAAAGALCWAVNPLRAEPVAWASSRIYCVAALFFFLAVLTYLRLSEVSGEKSRRRIWIVALLFGLSLFTYPIALGGLAVFIIVDFYPLKRLPADPRRWLLLQYRPVWKEKLIFLLPALVMFGVNFWARLSHPNLEAVITFSHYSIAARLMQACWVWCWYLWKPWLAFDLAPKYPELLTDSPFQPEHLIAAVFVLGISVLALWRRKTWPWLATAWLCYLALLLPLTGVTEHPHYTFDRYSYIVGAVWAVLIAGGIFCYLKKQGRVAPVLIGVLLLAGIWGRLAHEQTLLWNHSVSLQNRMAESLGHHPEAAKHEVAAATVLLAQHLPADATACLRRALALQPDMPEAWGALGDAFADLNRLEQSLSSYERALKLNPDLDSARQNLAVTLAMAGRHEEAVKHFESMLSRNPQDPGLHYNAALSLRKLGRSEKAELHMQEVRRLRNTAASKPQL